MNVPPTSCFYQRMKIHLSLRSDLPPYNFCMEEDHFDKSLNDLRFYNGILNPVTQVVPSSAMMTTHGIFTEWLASASAARAEVNPVFILELLRLWIG
ncbi:hypothetical protein D918_09750 [Trichuris suis]|nr:hypothetical protein D918_09750 [Trichuris suis]